MSEEKPILETFFNGGRKRAAEENGDLVICISGRPGTGKSTLGRQVGKNFDANFQTAKNMLPFPTMKLIKAKTEELKEKGAVIFMDEFMEIGYAQDWAKETSKELIKYFQMEARKFNKIFIIIIQNFWELHSSLRNSRIDFWFFVPKRGHCIVFEPDTHAFTDDPWNRKYAIKVKEKLRKRYGKLTGMSAQEQIEMYKRLPNYSFDFEFDKASEADEAEYSQVVATAKEEHKKLALIVQDDTRSVLLAQRRKLVAAMYSVAGFTQQQISEIVELPISVINEDLRLAQKRKLDKKAKALKE